MRRVLDAVDSNVQQAAVSEVGDVKPAKNKDTAEDARKAIEAIKSLSADLEESRSLYLQGNLQQYSTNRGKRKRESCFDQTSLSSPSSSSTFDIDWTHLKSWPQGLVEEEKAMIDYYRRLKLSHIEQETKNVFIHSIRDEPIKEKAYKDQRDKVQKVYSAEEVQELEVQVQKSKEELKERKRIAMEIRSHIESLADELGEMETLQGEVQEAQELADTIQELEVEWETLKARQDPNKGGAIAKKELSEMLKKEVMTTKGEALALYQQREREMQDLQSEEDSTKKAISRYQKELMGQKESLILLKEEQFGLEEIRERLIRDPKTEAQYKSKLATLTVLKGVLGITLIDAPASNILQSVYKVQDCQAKLVHNEVAVLIYFTHPGSRIKAYKLQNPADGHDLTDHFASPESPSRAHLDRAVAANDASLLIQEILVCIESIGTRKHST